MIVKVYDDGNYDSFQSNGCGCCSVEFCPDVEYWKEQDEWGMFPFEDKSPEQVAEEHRLIIIEHLKQNIKITKEACNKMGLDFQTLIEQ